MTDVSIIHGDSSEVVKALAADSVDLVLCDPPYALVSIGKRFGAEDAAPSPEGATGVYARAAAGFMGQRWDTGEVAFDPAFWREVMRVLKPGGHVVAFGGDRTYHRLACAIEDGGFEIRNMILDLVSECAAVAAFMRSLDAEQLGAFARILEESRFGGLMAWVYGSGFPKSHDAARLVEQWLGQDGAPEAADWEGWGTALKPAFEPIAVGRKPMIGPTGRNLLAHGVGALNIDACRIEGEAPSPSVARREASLRSGAGPGRPGEYGDTLRNRTTAERYAEHRNGEELGRWPANVVHDGSSAAASAFPDTASGLMEPHHKDSGSGDIYNPRPGRTLDVATFGDAGSPARFFYSAKADEEDRLGSGHPTVKRIDLLRWLARLYCRPGGTVLDPFAGSGTTGLAALGEGMHAILIEREATYVADIRRRIAWARGEGRPTRQEIMARDLAKDPAKATGADLPLFAGGAS